VLTPSTSPSPHVTSGYDLGLNPERWFGIRRSGFLNVPIHFPLEVLHTQRDRSSATYSNYQWLEFSLCDLTTHIHFRLIVAISSTSSTFRSFGYSSFTCHLKDSSSKARGSLSCVLSGSDGPVLLTPCDFRSLFLLHTKLQEFFLTNSPINCHVSSLQPMDGITSHLEEFRDPYFLNTLKPMKHEVPKYSMANLHATLPDLMV